jgi:type VI protein secretion system component Hcp
VQIVEKKTTTSTANAVCGQITITKFVDQTSPIILGQVLAGTLTPASTPVIFTFAHPISGPSGAQEVTFYSVTLQNVVPISITQSDDLGDRPAETVVLMASQFVFTYTPQDSTGRPLIGQQVTFGWDCTTNTRTQ